MPFKSFKKYGGLTILVGIGFWILSGCSSRQTTLQSSTTTTNSCAAGIVASLLPTSGISNGSATIGSPVVFQVSATGCSGNFVLVRSGYPDQSFSAAGASFSVTYSSPASGYFERVSIKSVDASGNTLSSAYATSTVFNIVSGIPALACTAVAQNSTGSVTVDTGGNVISPAFFQFTITPNASSQVRDVFVAGSSTAVTGVPTAFSTNVVVSSVPVRQLGSVNIAFSIQDSSNRTASCNTNITTTSATASAPTITSFTSSKPNSTSGDSVVYTLVTTNASTANINGTNVNLNATGTGTFNAVTITTGTMNMIATVSGPGGQATRSLTQTVNPGCTITTSASLAYKGDTYPFSVTILGQFQSASISGGGLTSFPLAPPPPTPPYLSTNYSPNVPVQSAMGAGIATLVVTGPSATSGQCTVPINTVDPTPVINFTFDGNLDADNSYHAGSIFKDVTVAWTTVNAASCQKDNGNNAGITGSTTVNSGILGGNNFTLNCFGPTGIKVSKTANVLP